MQGLIVKLLFHHGHNYEWLLNKAVSKQGLPILKSHLVSWHSSFKTLDLPKHITALLYKAIMGQYAAT